MRRIYFNILILYCCFNISQATELDSCYFYKSAIDSILSISAVDKNKCYISNYYQDVDPFWISDFVHFFYENDIIAGKQMKKETTAFPAFSTCLNALSLSNTCDCDFVIFFSKINDCFFSAELIEVNSRKIKNDYNNHNIIAMFTTGKIFVFFINKFCISRTIWTNIIYN